jgi:hypothetical protein
MFPPVGDTYKNEVAIRPTDVYVQTYSNKTAMRLQELELCL